MPPVPYTIRVETDDAIPVLVDGYLIQAYTSPGDVFVTSGITGAVITGEIDLTLDSGSSYLIRALLPNHSIAGLPTLISVVVPPPANLLVLVAHVGTTAPVATLELRDDLTNLLDGVTARIFDDTDIFVTEGVTGLVSPGIVDFALLAAVDPGQSYFVRWRPPAGFRIQGGNTQIIQVIDPLTPPQTNIFDFIAEAPVLPESDDAAMCLLSGYLGDVSKNPIRDGTIVFLPVLNSPTAKVSGFPFPTEPTVLDRTMLLNEVKVKSNAAGYVEVKLPRTSVLDVHIYGLETPGVEVISPIYVPDRLGAKLEDVLFPFITSVDTEFGAVALTVEETTELVITVEGSNDQPDLNENAGLFEFTSSDEDVVAVEFGDGVIILRGVAAGSATISVSRKEGTWAARVPAIPALVVTPSTEISVTVT